MIEEIISMIKTTLLFDHEKLQRELATTVLFKIKTFAKAFTLLTIFLIKFSQIFFSPPEGSGSSPSQIQQV